MKNYIVCMDDSYVRDTQMFDTEDMSEEDFLSADLYSYEMEDCWHDMAPTPYIGLVSAVSEEDACRKIGDERGYDPRVLYATEVEAEVAPRNRQKALDSLENQIASILEQFPVNENLGNDDPIYGVYVKMHALKDTLNSYAKFAKKNSKLGAPYTEYAVEVNNKNGFVFQVDVFETYEEASTFAETCNIELKDGEYLNIIFIDYDEEGNEIGFGAVC